MGGPVSLLNTVSLGELNDLVEKEFKLQNTMVETGVAKRMYISDSISANSGNTRRYMEVDTETFASIKPEGTNAQLAEVGTGYFVTGVVRRYAKEIQITWEMRRYNKFPEVTGQLTSLTQFIPQRRELDLTHRLTFGNVTSYVDMDGNVVDTTVGDGLSLFNAAHTLKYSSKTYSNIVSGAPAFSQAGLEAAELLAITNVMSNFGERRVMTYNTIWSSDDPGIDRLISTIMRSSTDVDQANSGVINFYKGRYTHLQLPYLATTATGAYDGTKKRWWGLGAFGKGINGWQAYFGEAEAASLKTPAAGNNGEDFHNDNWSYGVRGAWLIAVLSGRGILASLAV